MTALNTIELQDIQQAKKEELEAEFHVWLQSHFDPTQETYINQLIGMVTDEQFCKLAERWADETKPNKVFY